MRAILFRRMVVDGINYYQLFNEVDNFEPDEDFADFSHRTEKEYFYIDGDSDIEIPDASLLNIYCDSSDGIKNVLDSKIFMEVFNKFVEKYNIVIREIKPIDEVVENVSERIMFQEEVIASLVQRIYLNQSFVISDLPIELKNSQKANILFHGMSGSGKKTIINCLKQELGLPYVDITLSSSVKDILENILESLISQSNTDEMASCGIVFIHDNYMELSETLGDSMSAYNIIKFLTSQKVINYKGKMIDFRTITFVVLFDDDRNEYTFDEVQKITDCSLELSSRNLTSEEKYQVLFSENGSIYQYEKFLNHYGKKFIIDDKYLMKLITRCSELNPSMDAINKVINAIVSYGTYNGINDIEVNSEFMDVFNTILDQVLGKESEEIVEYDENQEKFLFEKEVDRVFNATKKYFIGQEKHVRMFINQLLSNLNVAEDMGLYSPESYMQNILIRGCTGSGKSFLVKTVSKIINAPFFVADATAYTEEGYVGLSPSDMFVGLYHAAGDNLERAQKGILFIDEIDKKAQDSGDHSGPTRKAVLNSLLKPTEGGIIHINVGSRMNERYVDFDTSHVTFICAGAFKGIEKIRDERIGKSKIGFGNQDAKKVDQNITNDDYISYGMPDEFMGRVNSYIELDDMTKETFIDIMKHSELSALKIKKYILERREIDLEYTEGFCEKLAEVALARKQGVRGIANALEEILASINIQDIRASQVEKIILNEDVIQDPSKVIIIERGKQKKLQIK